MYIAKLVPNPAIKFAPSGRWDAPLRRVPFTRELRERWASN